MIICSNLVAIVDLKSTTTRSVTDKKSKKVRKHGEVCYHSVPHWEEKNGNFPCAKGLICRPPAKAKSPKGKPVPYKCFKDNRKNRSKGNIFFNSKKSRADTESTLFTISYKMPKISGRESEEGDIAQLNEDCAKPIPTYKARNCVIGTTCKRRPGDNQSGSTSYCLADESKENETCFQSTYGYVKRTCTSGLECRYRNEDLQKGGTGYSKLCLPPKQLGKQDEKCGNMRGQVILTCGAGLACIKKPPVVVGDKTLTMSGIPEKFCLKDPTAGFENDACYSSTPGFVEKKCVDGLVCRVMEGKERLQGTTSYCLKPIKPAGLNEMCSQPAMTSGGIEKQCDTRYECKKRPSDASNPMASHYCLPAVINLLPIGAKCPSSSAKCTSGHSCKIKPEDIKGTNQTGVPSYCLSDEQNYVKQPDRNLITGGPGSLPPVSEGEICYRPIPDFNRRRCRSNFECKPTAEDVRLGKKGVSSICQKKAVAANEVSVAGEGQICAKSTPGFESKQCTAGTVCKPKSMQSGVSSVCTKSTSSTTTTTTTTTVTRLQIGGKCSSGGAKQCPSGHNCKNAFNTSAGSTTYCLLPSAFDQPGYTPFVGLNNYCNKSKPCTSGSTCTPVYDGSKVCIAKNYAYNGKPIQRRRR